MFTHFHTHPLNLIDLWLEQLQHDEDEEEEDESLDLTTQHNFQCSCEICGKKISWVHRYYYKCSQCIYVSHKFCAELPETLEDICQVGHTMRHLDHRSTSATLYLQLLKSKLWWCSICRHQYMGPICYYCFRCNFLVGADCAAKRLRTNIIHHPSHKHSLVCITKQILCECDACGKEHKGFFYHCHICINSFIHSDCAFLPKQMHIQHMTNDFFSHIHPLSLACSFPVEDQNSKYFPSCRVCNKTFSNENLWIYKCEKCRYYAHMDCATSRNEPFMSILTSPGTGKTIKNYDDAQHPDLLHLPFPDPSNNILKHLFFKENECSVLEVTKTHTSHQHPLILEDAQCSVITSPTSSRVKSISCHDPMKKIELLCDGCLRPITTRPVYVCANENEHCNFVLHEWCTRLPTELKDHPRHLKHTLVFHSKAPNRYFGVFYCDICFLPCNGFVYYCDKCMYYIDVTCAFSPKEITHASHPNHLLSTVQKIGNYKASLCRMCAVEISPGDFKFSCHICDDFHLHMCCALLIPETTTHKCDKHPMKLRYFPAENHSSEYFCEICEEEFNPNYPFYHCHECMQSMHPACASSILQYETHADTTRDSRAIHRFVNVKFGGTYNNIEVHPHPLSFRQGIARDGECDMCSESLQYEMIFKCLNCEFSVHWYCRYNSWSE